MDLFESVKGIRTIDAAELYGFHPNRAGMISCPFHKDRTPSMWLSDGFYCHSCHEKGDVIAFVAKAFNLSPKDAAQKLARDFGISYDGTGQRTAPSIIAECRKAEEDNPGDPRYRRIRESEGHDAEAEAAGKG